MKSFALALSFAVSFASLSAAENRPNILLILADDLGYGDLSCQGNPQVPTPHIDSIAKDGIRFTNGYVSGPYCSPTRAGLMTGRYQHRFGHEFNPGGRELELENFGLPAAETTLAERLKTAGYRTGLFGKWHLGYRPQFHPQKHGFDEYFGFPGGAHDYFDAKADPNNPILRGATVIEKIDHTTEEFARETVAFIERNRQQPWFAYLAFNAVHSPMQSPEKYLQRFSQIEDPKRRAFAAMLSAMDDAIGTVLTTLDKLHLDRNTLVFFFSDNGGPTRVNTSVNGPLRGYKAQTWEGGIRVPWLFRWKGRVPGGRVDDRPVIQLDILPTALAAAGVEPKPEWKLDGVNLLPFLDGRNPGRPHETLFWRLGQQMAIRRGDWKLVKGNVGMETNEGPPGANTDGAELFDLAQDIGEKKNLAAENPAKVKELAAVWQKWSGEMAVAKWIPDRTKGGGKKKAK